MVKCVNPVYFLEERGESPYRMMNVWGFQAYQINLTRVACDSTCRI